MTPAEAAAEARVLAAAWIDASPRLIDVLDWHERLCGTCGLERKCGEYGEIIDEYGAGPWGVTVFFPKADETHPVIRRVLAGNPRT